MRRRRGRRLQRGRGWAGERQGRGGQGRGCRGALRRVRSLLPVSGPDLRKAIQECAGVCAQGSAQWRRGACRRRRPQLGPEGGAQDRVVWVALRASVFVPDAEVGWGGRGGGAGLTAVVVASADSPSEGKGRARRKRADSDRPGLARVTAARKARGTRDVAQGGASALACG